VLAFCFIFFLYFFWRGETTMNNELLRGVSTTSGRK